MSSAFLCGVVFQSFLIAVFLHLAGGGEKLLGTPALKKKRPATTDSRLRKKPTPAL
jgi:hypothetical protein